MFDTSKDSPFHQGEKMIQQRVGKADVMEAMGRRIIRPYLPEQHREFYAQLPFMIVGSVDEQGRPWASILPGLPGFMQSPTPTTLDIMANPIQGDPLAKSIELGKPLGLLGIEIPTRRRNRLNARISSIVEEGFSVKVDQSFGNCPQYIQTRDFRAIENYGSKPAVRFTELDGNARQAISLADTFFVASNVVPKGKPDVEGVDVSHRGGRPGFVAVDVNTLTIPDYAGNNVFNTLGNFVLNPQAGLLFPNFETGELLFLSGSVEIIWEDDPVIKSFKGAERGWRFTVEHGIRIENALPFRASLSEYSANSLMTGDWAQTKRLEVAEKQRDQWQSYTIAKIIDETSTIRSFYLQKQDNGELVPFKAGQYLTIRLPTVNSTDHIVRTYTLSSAPNSNFYRISVKREKHGLGSNFLHQNMAVGSLLEAKSPKGNFWIDTAVRRSAVLLAGGVGVTPMISMALHTKIEGERMRYTRPLSIFHSAKSADKLAFSQNFKQLEVSSDKKISYFPLAGSRITKQSLLNASHNQELIQISDYFLCGPPLFMQAMYDMLIGLGVADAQVFAEAFGPASLKRIVNQFEEYSDKQEAEEATVEFRRSVIKQEWRKGAGTLLELAEHKGLSPAYSCRSGNCGSCAVKLCAGEVVYKTPPTADLASDEVLICCAVPALSTDTVILDL